MKEGQDSYNKNFKVITTYELRTADRSHTLLLPLYRLFFLSLFVTIRKYLITCTSQI